MKDFGVRLVGKLYSLDGGENNFRGADGWLGDFETFEQAFGAAVAKATDSTVVEIHDRGAEANPVLTCDGEYLRRLKTAQAERGRKGGLAATDAKAEAARRNGARGGRPRKADV